MHSRVTDDNIMCLEANKQKYISSLLEEAHNVIQKWI